MMLKMVSGTLVGDNEYNAVYNNNEKHLNTAKKNENDISIPTLASVARKVADLQGKKLDKKQYASYEIIACSFLLQLIQDGSNKNSDL